MINIDSIVGKEITVLKSTGELLNCKVIGYYLPFTGDGPTGCQSQEARIIYSTARGQVSSAGLSKITIL